MKAALAALLTLGALFAQERAPTAAAKRPNLVLILSDDQGFGDYGFMGHPVIETPNLDRLAAESLVFPRGYVPTALCCPSLATILTGTYPHQHGFTGNDPVKGKDRNAWIEPFGRMPQVPALLAAAGYRTLETGKYWQGDPKVSGFTDSMGETGRHGGQALAIGRETLRPIEDFVAAAQEQQQPFLLWYAPFLPHTPHTPPERLLAKYRDKAADLAQAKYFAMCEWLDETCGELLGLLDERGLRDDTIVLFLSDNGWSQGEAGFRGSKQTLWEHGVRQPFLIRWPGRVLPRRDEQHLASSIDLAPTMLAAAGVPIPDTMRGVNLLDAAAVAARDAVFCEDFTHDMAAPDDPAATLEGRAVICGEWKLIVTRGDKRARMDPQTEGVFLFDVVKDPKEQHDVAAEHPERVAELRRRLDAWWDPAAKPRR
ncbi:MAG: sulfatase [Planctomycetes bacterium]|nr:sulfatase [Planctomycetota bacterium]